MAYSSVVCVLVTGRTGVDNSGDRYNRRLSDPAHPCSVGIHHAESQLFQYTIDLSVQKNRKSKPKTQRTRKPKPQKSHPKPRAAKQPKPQQDLSYTKGAHEPAASPKRILLQHTLPIPGRPRAGTKQTKRARKKLPKPKPKGDGKRPPTTKAKDPETAREARREYEHARNRTPERREYRRRYAEVQRQRAKQLGKCQKCSKPAIPGQTRCKTCARNHRQSPGRSDAMRRDAAKETAATGQAYQGAGTGV